MFEQVSLPTSYNCSKKAWISKQVQQVGQISQKDSVSWSEGFPADSVSLLTHKEVFSLSEGWWFFFLQQPLFISVIVLLQVQHDQPKSQVTYHTRVWHDPYFDELIGGT